MTATTARGETAIKRCAVCKVDLKGRFVFVDEAIESMLEQSMEQLFGQPIFSFLDKPSQGAVKELLKKRSSFETSFDSCCINLIASSGREFSANMIISLCFAAGNPVNYQVLITPDSSAVSPSPVTEKNMAQDLLEALAQLEPDSNIESIISPIAAYLAKAQTALYQFENDQLILIESDSQAPQNLADISALHHEVMIRNRAYRPDDSELAQWAIELVSEAPNEILIPISGAGDQSCLLRVLPDDKLSETELADLNQRVNHSARLIALWLGRLRSDDSHLVIDDSSETESALGLDIFARLGLPAFVTASNGRLVASNGPAVELSASQLEGKHYHELLADSICPVAETDLTALRLFLEHPASPASPKRYQISVNLPNQKLATLVIFRSDQGESGSSFIFVILPQPSVTADDSSDPRGEVARQALASLEPLLRTTTEFADKLSHEQYQNSSQDGSFTLLCLMDCLGQLGDNLRLNQRLLEIGRSRSISTRTDLNVLLGNLQAQLRRDWPEHEINLEFSSLPTLKGSPAHLGSLLEILMSQLIPGRAGKIFKAKLALDDSNNELTLTLSLPSNFPEARVIELSQLVSSSSQTKSLSGIIMNSLLTQMKSRLDISAKNHCVTIPLPEFSLITSSKGSKA